MNKIQYKKRNSEKLFTEATPGAKNLNNLYAKSWGNILLELFIKKKYISKLFGKLMDLSISKIFINSFITDYQIEMNRYEKSKEEFTSFNDFFTRKLTSENQKIEINKNEVISPADGKILVYQSIKISQKHKIKNIDFTLKNLLKSKKLADTFAEGALAIIRLAPTDYHRFHFPVSGEIGVSHLINGDLYSVSPLALKHNKKIFEMNKREISILENPNLGRILYCEIGATFVGSIIQTYKPGKINAGDEKGYFKFGGSTIVLLFEKNRIEFDKNLLSNTESGYETEIKFGDKIAQRRNDE